LPHLDRLRHAARVDFVFHPVGGDRIHYVGRDDVGVVLSRLPAEVVTRLRAVHFADRSRGAKVFGYVTAGRREITLCALPPRVRLTTCAPRTFGAEPHLAWPRVAVRRFMLYDVLLHELGHMQIVRPEERAVRRRFADETLACEFAARWRAALWSEPFDHPDPSHHPPAVNV
jgi:hypothetical protein